MIQLRDLNRQYNAMKQEMDQAMAKVVGSAQFIMGEEVHLLEEELAAYVGTKHCITCGNGTDALHLAMMALGVGQGDAVFVPDFTFFATAEAVAISGATPIMVDVDPLTYNISFDDLKRKYSNLVNSDRGLNAKAVIAVDLFGLPADFKSIVPWAHSVGMQVVEDGAQGFGGEREGSKVCSMADVGVTSFFPAKPLGCYGDGGALFTNDGSMADCLRSLRVHGKGRDKYDNVRIGLNSRLDTLQAAVLRVKLAHFDDELARVRDIADCYGAMIKSRELRLPTVAQGYQSAWAQFTIRTDHRDALQQKLKSAGIASGIYYPRTISSQPAFAHLRQEPCPEARTLAESVLSIPINPYLSDDEIKYIADALC